MGGVDRVDQLLQYYSFLRKSIKWYKKVAFHLFDVALLNSQILWMKAHPDAKMTGLEFRMTVVEQIIHKTGADPSASCKGGRPSGSVLPTRLTARHFPSLIPPTERRHVVFRQCRLCNKGMGRRHVAGDDRRRIETKVQCTECGDIPLCSAPCFGLWHTEVDIWHPVYDWYPTHPMVFVVGCEARQIRPCRVFIQTMIQWPLNFDIILFRIKSCFHCNITCPSHYKLVAVIHIEMYTISRIFVKKFVIHCILSFSVTSCNILSRNFYDILIIQSFIFKMMYHV